ncbi:hypothetical protein Sme01_22900 [Sphaerisporangium melleum]|uniref:Transmembrane transport protein n=1 Tax=Sphaerisporangium melleum TaxID=321316 RepID=A0A917QYJ1_9ACTN|nr:hypothetical protein [Sphaerisporangium melleum]GGK78428.1 hypothetical protein GCM10007964_21470 [Sphaerisporangium melleum]GII69814.1 hypothetical protein Sme01_22900 [Sphaerisporangium melleum]
MTPEPNGPKKPDEPWLSAEEMIGRLSGVLSPWQRIRGAVALLAGVAGAVFIGSLWATEPGPLPVGTRLAFAGLAVFCLAWAGYGGWLVTRRVPLFAADQVYAGRLALVASTLTMALTVALTVQRGTGVLAAVLLGALFVALAATLTVRAHRTRAALLRRRRELLDQRATGDRTS